MKTAIICALLVAAVNCRYYEWNSTELVEMREHILRAYKLRPEPVDQCDIKSHHAALRMYTKLVPADEQAEVIKDIQYSIVRKQQDYFLGLSETLAAISGSKIQYILYWDKLLISSATYRNPLSGKTITLHRKFQAVLKMERNYTDPETGCYMELWNCFPFVKWINYYWQGLVPTPIRLETDVSAATDRNLFVSLADGIGGRFFEPIVFTNNSWLDRIIEHSEIRSKLYLNLAPDQTDSSIESLP